MRGTTPSQRRRPGKVVAAATASAAVGVRLPALARLPATGAGTPDVRGIPLQRAFTETAERYHVPRGRADGRAYMEARRDTHRGPPSVTAGYRPRHLTAVRMALAEFPSGVTAATILTATWDVRRPTSVRTPWTPARRPRR